MASSSMCTRLSYRVIASLCLVSLSGAAFDARLAGATTRTVPSPYATIEEAVAAAAGGDTILVSPGTYTPEVALSKSLTLTSVSGSATTFLDGEDAHGIITDITADVRISGFSFTRGGTGMSTPEGGAVFVSASGSLAIEDCVFTENRAVKGGAISSHGPLTILRCRFEANSPLPGQTFPGSTCWGGAVIVWNDVEALVESCFFTANRSFLGGGIQCLGQLTVRQSTFEDNFANGKGAGISVVTNMGNAPTLVEHSTFRRNSGGEGGGIVLTSIGPKTVRDCLFEENNGRQVGGGIAASSTGAFLVERCRFIANRAGGQGQGGGGIFTYVITDGITIRECVFHRNRCEDEFDIEAGGGGLWIAQNGQTGADVSDCTFTENEAARGAAVLIEPSSVGPMHPVFTRCIFAYNHATTTNPLFGVFSCGFPGQEAEGAIQCSAFRGNLPSNQFCAIDDGDVYRLESPTDVLFCDDTYSGLCENSTAFTAACGPMGGLSSCGTCVVPVKTASWGKLKAIYGVPPVAR